ncbi:serine/threonine-protein kinase [Actinomadura macrotermitis]|uniref:non-specific serine/threonine protein kinase n=1 Tax=Actinomadura macrotermitis TaxID=2585200 RepID=A0A7K0C3T8_9ACTN|nr:serine/threonine-protein kinase [Actinomadura macrotermitis]MQY07762.1 Serine/threonine-protein kinase PknD [Actinomadura macrotermitis]
MVHGLLGGRYELTAQLGRGGMGQVWAAADRRTGGRVAVKLLTHETIAGRSDPAELIRRFSREVSVTSGFSHPGVPAVHDTGIYEGGLYLVMDLVEGRTVDALVAEEGPLPAGTAAAAGVQICAVLAHAHARGLVHRDIKPQNLMVTPDGTVKVLDFGIASVLDTDTKITQTGAALGTVAYMSPEQVRGEPVGPRTDLYALGCVLYEMLAGRRVFSGVSPHSLGYQHLERAPEPIGRADVPVDLERLILQMLAKDPAQRPTGAEEVRARLLPHAAGARALTVPPPRLDVTALPAGASARTLPPVTTVPPMTAVPPPPGFPPPIPQPLPYTGHHPVQQQRLGVGWHLLHSLWVLPTFSIGMLPWAAFLYIGIRHRHRVWLATALAYLALTIAMLVVIVTTPDSELGPNGNPVAAMTFLIVMTLVPPVHAFLVNIQRLRLRAQPPPHHHRRR